MIYSNLDEIVLLPNQKFYSNLLTDESNLFKILIPKDNGDIKKIRVMLNDTEKSEIEIYEKDRENLAINVENIRGIKYCDFIPIKNNNNEYEIKFNIKAKEKIYYYIENKLIGEEDTFNVYNLTFDKIKEISAMNSFPIKIFSKLPLTKEINTTYNEILLEEIHQTDNNNSKDLIFNCYFQILNSEESDIINTIDEIEINATLINRNELNEIIETKKDSDYLKSSLNKKFDKSTKSVILNINSDFINKNKNDEELILYMSINYVNNNIKKNINLSSKLLAFYKNDLSFIIPSNNYINDNLIVNGKYNYNLYHLKLEKEEKIKYIIEFSSNYELNNKEFFISFLDYNNINNIQPENYLTNSTNINFMDSKRKIGSINQFEFTLKEDSIKDIILCVATNLQTKKGGISTINYVFKYNTYSLNEYTDIITYNFSEILSNKGSSLIFSSINTKSKDNQEDKVYGEISIRKILSTDRLNNEKLDTIAIIESKYDLVNADETRDSKNTNLKIKNMNIKNEYYSIVINSPIYNQKFVFNTIPEGIIENGKKKNVLAIVLICVSVLIVLIFILVVIKIFKKNKNLKEEVMKTSFEKSGMLEQLNEMKSQ